MKRRTRQGEGTVRPEDLRFCGDGVIIEPIMSGSLDFMPVRIGDGSDRGCNAVVLGGVTIGQGVQVGAGAVAREDLPAFGVPARVVRQRR